MKKTLQLTKWWQKAVCTLGIPLLANTIAAIYFLNKISMTIAFLVTILFIYDVVKRRRGKIIWDLDDKWERIVYKLAWISFVVSLILIMLTFIVEALRL